MPGERSAHAGTHDRHAVGEPCSGVVGPVAPEAQSRAEQGADAGARAAQGALLAVGSGITMDIRRPPAASWQQDQSTQEWARAGDGEEARQHRVAGGSRGIDVCGTLAVPNTSLSGQLRVAAQACRTLPHRRVWGKRLPVLDAVPETGADRTLRLATGSTYRHKNSHRRSPPRKLMPRSYSHRQLQLREGCL